MGNSTFRPIYENSPGYASPLHKSFCASANLQFSWSRLKYATAPVWQGLIFLTHFIWDVCCYVAAYVVLQITVLKWGHIIANSVYPRQMFSMFQSMKTHWALKKLSEKSLYEYQCCVRVVSKRTFMTNIIFQIKRDDWRERRGWEPSSWSF